MPYEMKPLACNPGTLTGLSEKIVVSHYENNYGGAVMNDLDLESAGAAWMQPIQVVADRAAGL